MLCSKNNLTGKVLIASPSTDQDSYFFKTVIYILRNLQEESVGLIINHPLPKIKNNFIVKHEGKTVPLNIEKAYSGGPLEAEKGFLLHIDKYPA